MNSTCNFFLKKFQKQKANTKFFKFFAKMMPPSMNSNVNDDDLDIYGFLELVKSIPSQIFSPSFFQLMIWKWFLSCFITTIYFFCNHIVTRNNICIWFFLLFTSFFCAVGIYNAIIENFFMTAFLWFCTTFLFFVSLVSFTYVTMKEHFWDAWIIICHQFALQKEKKNKNK